MVRYIALLRAINVGGRNVKMEDLRRHFIGLGLSSVETFIASGNVIFETASSDEEELRERIETSLGETLGFSVATFLRTDRELHAAASHPAFSQTAIDAAGAYCVGFLSKPLSEEGEKKVAGFTSEIDKFHVHGKEVYWLCTRKQSESKFTNAAFERALRMQSTFRSMSTVRKLVEKYPSVT